MSRILVPLAWIAAIAFCLACWWLLYITLETAGVLKAVANVAALVSP